VSKRLREVKSDYFRVKSLIPSIEANMFFREYSSILRCYDESWLAD